MFGGCETAVLEEEVCHLVVAFANGPDEGNVAEIANIGRIIAWKCEEVPDDGEVVTPAGPHDDVSLEPTPYIRRISSLCDEKLDSLEVATLNRL